MVPEDEGRVGDILLGLAPVGAGRDGDTAPED